MWCHKQVRVLQKAPFSYCSGLITFKTLFLSHLLKSCVSFSASKTASSGEAHSWFQTCFIHIWCSVLSHKYVYIHTHTIKLTFWASHRKKFVWSCTPPGTVPNMTYTCPCRGAWRGGICLRSARSKSPSWGSVAVLTGSAPTQCLSKFQNKYICSSQKVCFSSCLYYFHIHRLWRDIRDILFYCFPWWTICRNKKDLHDT